MDFTILAEYKMLIAEVAVAIVIIKG